MKQKAKRLHIKDKANDKKREKNNSHTCSCCADNIASL